MDIKISTKQILKFLNILAWIIFIGLCVDAGGIFFNSLFIHFVNPNAATQSWKGVDLSNLYNFDTGHFFVETTLMSIVMIMKAILFYIIVKVLHYKKLDVSHPFSTDVRKSIFKLSYIALGIGLFSIWGLGYTKWLVEQGVQMPDIKELRFGGADVWLFMSVILFVIAQIFKRGIEFQEENDLTI